MELGLLPPDTEKRARPHRWTDLDSRPYTANEPEEFLLCVEVGVTVDKIIYCVDRRFVDGVCAGSLPGGEVAIGAPETVKAKARRTAGAVAVHSDGRCE